MSTKKKKKNQANNTFSGKPSLAIYKSTNSLSWVGNLELTPAMLGLTIQPPLRTGVCLCSTGLFRGFPQSSLDLPLSAQGHNYLLTAVGFGQQGQAPPCKVEGPGKAMVMEGQVPTRGSTGVRAPRGKLTKTRASYKFSLHTPRLCFRSARNTGYQGVLSSWGQAGPTLGHYHGARSAQGVKVLLSAQLMLMTITQACSSKSMEFISLFTVFSFLALCPLHS